MEWATAYSTTPSTTMFMAMIPVRPYSDSYTQLVPVRPRRDESRAISGAMICCSGPRHW